MTVKWILHLGISLFIVIISTADLNTAPTAKMVHWQSLDFKTVLIWSTSPSNHAYTVRYSEQDQDFQDTPHCIQLSDSESECDLTHELQPFDRTYIADILTEAEDYDYPEEEPPHTLSPPFNPYKESNISAVTFTVANVDKTRVLVNITDPLTSIHSRGRQLTIRDVLKADLKYKISYSKAGSTGKKDIISDSNEAEVPDLDPGQSYCFMVAAYIPSRPKSNQQGALSQQLCTHRGSEELSPETWIVIVLTVASIIIIVAIILYCKCCRRRNQNLHMPQSSAPI